MVCKLYLNNTVILEGKSLKTMPDTLCLLYINGIKAALRDYLL